MSNNYNLKYLKYKKKYQDLKNQLGSGYITFIDNEP